MANEKLIIYACYYKKPLQFESPIKCIFLSKQEAVNWTREVGGPNAFYKRMEAVERGTDT